MATNRGESHYLHPWFGLLPKKDSPREAPAEVRKLGELFRDKVIENLKSPLEKRNLDQINDLFGEKGVFPLQEGSLLKLADDAWKSRHTQLADVVKQRTKELPPEPAKSISLVDNNPRDIQLHIRGNPNKRGPMVQRRFLKILSTDERVAWKEGSGRRQLAEAIASPTNPLTARVIVNRVWQQHFGEGIVATPSNFGELGARPTHPELLDYLAAQFVKGGWSLKKLHREILLSTAYRRASTGDEANQRVDPENRLLWRYSPRRLTVEQFRDSVLIAAGALQMEGSGPGQNLDDPASFRRTIYGKVSRKEPSKFLTLWDFADANLTVDRRSETTLPQQMLFLMNGPFVVGNAKALAARIDMEKRPADKVRKAYELVFARPPTTAELTVIEKFLAAEDQLAAGEKPSELSRTVRFAQSLLASNEFYYLD